MAPRDAFIGASDSDLLDLAAKRVTAVRSNAYLVSGARTGVSSAEELLRPCIPAGLSAPFEHSGGAMLVGLSPTFFGWDLKAFASTRVAGLDATVALQELAGEYEQYGINEKFTSVIQGSLAVLGRARNATLRAFASLGLGELELGSAVGSLDCHVGGIPGSCSENAAVIRFAPNSERQFKLFCTSDEDVVAVNGKRVVMSHGGVPLRDEDVCSVGSRVFAFVVPKSR